MIEKLLNYFMYLSKKNDLLYIKIFYYIEKQKSAIPNYGMISN